MKVTMNILMLNFLLYISEWFNTKSYFYRFSNLQEGLRKNSSRMLRGKIKLDHEVAGNYLSDFLETQLALHPICFCEECGNACDYLDVNVINVPKRLSTVGPDFQMLQSWNNV